MLQFAGWLAAAVRWSSECDHGVRALRSRLLLHEVPLGPATLLNTRVPN
jgi:hypothetical protein